MRSDDPYSQYEMRMGELHALDRGGKLDSEEADELRDTMSELWKKLSPIERARLQGLSHDLYSLGGEEEATEAAPLPSNDTERKQLMAQAGAAYDSRRWEDLLALLRRLRLEFPAPLVAYMRHGLDQDPSGDLPEQMFLKLLSYTLPESEAEAALRVAVEWGRYGDLFAYNYNTGVIHLPDAAETAA